MGKGKRASEKTNEAKAFDAISAATARRRSSSNRRSSGRATRPAEEPAGPSPADGGREGRRERDARRRREGKKNALPTGKSEKWRPNGKETSTAAKNSDKAKARQAQRNVQVVRGKVTTRCLWNACKALSIGLLLLAIGTAMAVVGYYADQLSIRSETRGNSTVKIKNESRGFHLNNLSYAGPVVMGIGGFIVVAACVMTFEARDSAAKVVPARFKPSLNASASAESAKTTPPTSRTFQRSESKRCASVQTPSAGGGGRSPENDFAGRKAFAAAFVQFSREPMENSASDGGRRRQKASDFNLNKSPSAPDLTSETSACLHRRDSEFGRRACAGSPESANRTRRESVRPLEAVSGGSLVRPGRLHRRALSMDDPFHDGRESHAPPSTRPSRRQSERSGGSKDSFEVESGSSAGLCGSQASMALDLHECRVTLEVKDESASKRSDTARRHRLLRQKPVEDDVAPRCARARGFCCASAGEECRAGTESSGNLRSLRLRRLRATATCAGRGRVAETTAGHRSRSFSRARSLAGPKKCTSREFDPRIFRADDRRRTNPSPENARPRREEKLRLPGRRSPDASPRGSPRSERRTPKREGFECPVHGAGGRRKEKKAEGSPSAEERARSASFSPAGKTPFRDRGSPRDQSRRSAAAGDAKEERAEEPPRGDAEKAGRPSSSK